MPEGDTVFLLARKLDRALRGREVVRSDFRVPQLATRDLSGRTVLGHATHGKHLLTRFSEGITLHSHLLMDGEWTATGPGRRLPARMMKDVRLALETSAGTAWGLRLHQLDLVATAQEDRLVGHLGPDPLREDWDPAEAVRRLGSDPERPFVSALLDQTLMAGLGNLWVNELAFVLGINPWRPVGQTDLTKVVDRAARFLRHSARTPGAYQVTTGNARPGQDHWVYGRRHRPCRRCGTGIERRDEVPNDRDRRVTYWCPHCQPGPAPE